MSNAHQPEDNSQGAHGVANEPDNVNAGALAVMITLVALSTLAVATVVTALVRREVAEVGADRDSSQDRTYRDLKAEALSKLQAAPSWSDRAKGLAMVPIDRAMALTLEAVRENPYALSPGIKPEAMGGAGPEEEAKKDASTENGEATPGEAQPETAPTDSKEAPEKPGSEKPGSEKPGSEKEKPKKLAPAPAPPVAPAPAPAPPAPTP